MNRAKLYYLREKVGKKARVRELRQTPAQVAATKAEAEARRPRSRPTRQRSRLPPPLRSKPWRQKRLPRQRRLPRWRPPQPLISSR